MTKITVKCACGEQIVATGMGEADDFINEHYRTCGKVILINGVIDPEGDKQYG